MLLLQQNNKVLTNFIANADNAYPLIERLTMHLLLLNRNNRCGFYSNDIPWHWRPDIGIKKRNICRRSQTTGRWLFAIINIFNVWFSIVDSSKSRSLIVCLSTLCCMHSIGGLHLELGTINNINFNFSLISMHLILLLHSMHLNTGIFLYGPFDHGFKCTIFTITGHPAGISTKLFNMINAWIIYLRLSSCHYVNQMIIGSSYGFFFFLVFVMQLHQLQAALFLVWIKFPMSNVRSCFPYFWFGHFQFSVFLIVMHCCR